jgi:CRP-like cAMP-binding protein
MNITANELFEFFQANLICESLTLNEVDAMRNYLQEKELKPNEVIVDMGEVGTSMYFIYKGKVAFTSSNGQTESMIGKQETGSLIGEMSFFDGEPRQLRMTAGKNPVKLIEITRAMYDRLKVEYPYIAVNLLENAIVSLDHLVRAISRDLSHIGNYMHGTGKR